MNNLILMYVGTAAISFVVVAVVVWVFLWAYNRREKRRKHALQIANLMRTWGLGWFAELYDDYAVGDYSGIVYKLKEVVEAVRSDAAMVAKLEDVALKVAAYSADNAPELAAKLLKALGKAAPATPAATVAAPAPVAAPPVVAAA